jgi:hypothetical protein
MKAFFALEPRWLGRDRFYKIYLTDHDLRGALIGRQVYDKRSAHCQLIAPAQIFAPLMMLWADRILKKVHQREQSYDGMVLSSHDFTKENRLNFLIYRHDILGVCIDRKKRMWTSYSNAGTLRLETRDHSEREWIIVGDQDIDAIAASLGVPAARL